MPRETNPIPSCPHLLCSDKRVSKHPGHLGEPEVLTLACLCIKGVGTGLLFRFLRRGPTTCNYQSDRVEAKWGTRSAVYTTRQTERRGESENAVTNPARHRRANNQEPIIILSEGSQGLTLGLHTLGTRLRAKRPGEMGGSKMHKK